MDGEDGDKDGDEDGNGPEFTILSSPPKTLTKPVRQNLLVDAAWGAVLQLQKTCQEFSKLVRFSKDNFIRGLEMLGKTVKNSMFLARIT